MKPPIFSLEQINKELNDLKGSKDRQNEPGEG